MTLLNSSIILNSPLDEIGATNNPNHITGITPNA